MSSKPEKSQSHKRKEDKKPVESKKYAQVSSESITSMADSIGISNLTEDVIKPLAEDVSYRLREVIHNLSVYLRHSKRKKLLTSDVNQVFTASDIPPVLGHSSSDPPNFVYIKEADCFVLEDTEVDVVSMALSEEVIPVKPEPKIQATWVLAEKSDATTVPTTKEEESSSAPSVDKSCKIHSNLMKYYRTFANVILSPSKHITLILSDLRTNPKIVSVVPFFLNMLASGLEKLPHTIWDRLLNCIEALQQNKHTHPAGSDTVQKLLPALLLVALSPQEKGLRDLDLRERAAHLLARALWVWTPCEAQVHRSVVRKLATTLLDHSCPLYSHFGALAALHAIGSVVLDYCLWPHLVQYLDFLTSQPLSYVRVQVEGKLLLAIQVLYHCLTIHPAPHNVLPLEERLYEYFGDTLIAWRRAYVSSENGVREVSDSPDPNVHIPPSEFELEYQNRGGHKQINIQSYQHRGVGSPRTAPLSPSKRRNRRSITSLSNVFENVPVRLRKPRECVIKFRFAGSKPLTKRHLPPRRTGGGHTRFSGGSLYFRSSCHVSVGRSWHNRERQTLSVGSLWHTL